MKTIIKRHSNKNQYILTPQGHWCRDFTKKIFPQDINSFVGGSDVHLLASNELTVKSMNIANIDTEFIRAPNVCIVSDGYKFKESRSLLKTLPRNVIVIGVNRSLANWDSDLRMDYFLNNNPYAEAMAQMPTGNYVPKCIVSCRVYPEFVKRYRMRRGLVYKYVPTKDREYGGTTNAIYYIDDYRNPICASIGLAYRWGARKVMLFCCDDVFEGERPGSVLLENGLHMYPQHTTAHGFIEGCLYWLKRQEYNPVEVVNFSKGLNYEEVPYINEEEVSKFFK
jgi:hypothetical protein